MTNDHLTLHPEVQEALATGTAVVALESTIVAHGMPWPKNFETAVRMENIIRGAGAVPATIAVLDGQISVGLDEQQLERVAQSESFLKASTRDLALLVSKGSNAATTVAATMFIASLTGIEVFVTGGIGGVHRGAENTFDVSADLTELRHTNVVVVCSGAKAILDLELTLEYLETQGVPVIGFRTERFPAFYVRDSGCPIDHSVQTVDQLARAVQAQRKLELRSGIVVANPIPEEHELDRDLIESAIAGALQEANVKQISGKQVTPWLLARIEELTGGRSLRANIELVCHNASLGAELAKACASSKFDSQRRGHAGAGHP